MKYLNHPWIFLLLSIVITITVKIPHLGLPYFFDETSSYIPAIHEMVKAGPNMLPGSIPLEFSKGHPLFFYFMTSLWMKFIAGESLILMRVFPLMISVIALVVFHRFAKRHTNILLANVAVVLLSLQPLFLAQASLVLPEILLFTLFILCFDSYLSRNYAYYAFYGSLMMLTKETGAVFIMLFGFAYLVENYLTWNTKVFWRNLFLLSIPGLVYLVFLILHYLEFGTFFFAEHLDYVTIDSTKMLYKFNSATSTLFLAHGRNVIFFAAILVLIILLFRKISIAYKRFLILTVAIIIPFLIFTILNFFTYRYVFPVMGIVLLASLVIIQQLQIKYQVVNLFCIACLLSISAYYSATKRGNGDADLGYTQFVVVHQQIVSYCEQQGWYDKELGVGSNLVMVMNNPRAHYLSTGKTFHVHLLPGIENRDLIIYDSTCYPSDMPEIEKNKLTLIKRFEYKNHWGEIYENTNFTSR
jgi:4-amino-4-deoxy-L-arabinose transferase-like glycosyltransferase